MANAFKIDVDKIIIHDSNSSRGQMTPYSRRFDSFSSISKNITPMLPKISDMSDSSSSKVSKVKVALKIDSKDSL